MKHLLLPAAILLLAAQSASAQYPWKAVTGTEELTAEGLYAIGYVNNAGAWKAPGDVMSYNIAPPNRGFYAIENCDIVDDVLMELPAEAAIVRLEAAGEGFYNIYLTNGPQPGYIVPLDTGRNGITISDTPMRAKITFGMGAQDDSSATPEFTAKIVFDWTGDEARADFSWVYTAVGGKMTHVFWSCAQADSGGSMKIFKEDTTQPPKPVYTASPVPGAYDEFPEITLAYQGATAVQIEEGATATLTLGGYTFPFNMKTEENKVIISSEEPVTAYSGPYTPYLLDIPAGAFKISYGETVLVSEAIQLDGYSINPPQLSNLEILNGLEAYPSTEAMNGMEFGFSQPFNLNAVNTKEPLTIIGQTLGAQGTLKITDTRDNSFTASIDWVVPVEEIPSDDYVITIPAEALVLSNDYGYIFRNEEAFNFQVTLDLDLSVAGISADDVYTVYTTDGICLLREGTRAEFEALPSGIYICNKVLIKK